MTEDAESGRLIRPARPRTVVTRSSRRNPPIGNGFCCPRCSTGNADRNTSTQRVERDDAVHFESPLSTTTEDATPGYLFISDDLPWPDSVDIAISEQRLPETDIGFEQLQKLSNQHLDEPWTLPERDVPGTCSAAWWTIWPTPRGGTTTGWNGHHGCAAGVRPRTTAVAARLAARSRSTWTGRAIRMRRPRRGDGRHAAGCRVVCNTRELRRELPRDRAQVSERVRNDPQGAAVSEYVVGSLTGARGRDCVVLPTPTRG